MGIPAAVSSDSSKWIIILKSGFWCTHSKHRMTNRKIELNICIIKDVFNDEQIMPVCDNLLTSVSR